MRMTLPLDRNFYIPMLLSIPFWAFLVRLTSLLGPAEDATILFCYSENLSTTGVISYYPGGQPTEGATDFLWMLLLAFGHKIGISTHFAAQFLSALSILASYTVLYHLVDKEKRTVYTGIFCLFSVLLCEQVLAAIVGFSPIFFGFFILLSLYFFFQGKHVPLLIASLILGLVRPDGLFIGIPLVVGSIFQDSQTLVTKFRQCLVFAIIPGAIYFILRYLYFGFPLPLPFYVKALTPKVGGIFVYESLLTLGIFTGRKLLFMLASLVYSLRKEIQSTYTTRIAILAIFILPACAYSVFSLEQNIENRLIYPLFIGTLGVFVHSYRNLPVQKLAATLTLGLTLVFFVFSLPESALSDNNTLLDQAKKFQGLPNVKLAATEAGRLTYYTEWESFDLWGLNTPAVKDRLVQREDLANFQPDLIMLQPGDYTYCNLVGAADSAYKQDKTWNNMVFNAFKYAWESNNYSIVNVRHEKDVEETPTFLRRVHIYTLALRNWVKPQDPPPLRWDLYLVRKDSEAHDTLISLLRENPYLQSTSDCL